MASASISLSSILNPNPRYSLFSHTSSLSIFSPLAAPPCHTLMRAIHSRETPPKTARRWKIHAVSEEALPLPPEANPIDSSQQIVSGGDDGVSNIISVLLFIAFLGLSILTIGVIYIAVTDFLRKRERDKFEKEEAAKKNKSGKKRPARPRARAGPRGFGQKIEDDDDGL
ncbi:uncharacterized protein LOC127793469 [Diospyros lotus]|uniref:uncharacterized protein LOC127793469 n=1 Tax=Diospyros lotus TaxID=55363 RepID=UPI00225C1C99|nr:uncharacterized protein LOC127793469 [Diospyros lotus]